MQVADAFPVSTPRSAKTWKQIIHQRLIYIVELEHYQASNVFFVASGLRYDLAVEDPEYVKELVSHHVGGYLKIAPEHTEGGPLSKMMKPGMGTYYRFKEMFEKFLCRSRKESNISSHILSLLIPGTTDEDMMNLAIWLKSKWFPSRSSTELLPLAYGECHGNVPYRKRSAASRVDYKSDNVAYP